MTRDEFITGYVRRSGLDEYRTEDGYHIPGCNRAVALPCQCGEEGCEGWAMITDDDLGSVAWHMYRNGPDQDREGHRLRWEAAIREASASQ